MQHFDSGVLIDGDRKIALLGAVLHDKTMTDRNGKQLQCHRYLIVFPEVVFTHITVTAFLNSSSDGKTIKLECVPEGNHLCVKE
jgi:hypothetical protein